MKVMMSNDIDGTMYREIKKAIIAEFGKDNPGTGNSYIAEDGTFIQLYPKIDTHEDMCYWIEDNFDVTIDYPDEEWAISEFGWIRLRKDPNMAIVELPADRPTNSQLYALDDWLQYVESQRAVTLYLGILNSTHTQEFYLGSDVFSEDVMHTIKSYYTRRSVCSNSQVGSYRGVPYGQQDNGDNLFYFEVAPGRFEHASLEDELHSKIDSFLDKPSYSADSYADYEPDDSNQYYVYKLNKRDVTQYNRFMYLQPDNRYRYNAGPSAKLMSKEAAERIVHRKHNDDDFFAYGIGHVNNK